MRPILRIIVGGFAFVGILATGVFLMTLVEEPRSHFATYADLAASDLIAKGWLPEFLPKTIHDISEGHSLDSNRVWATFKYDPSDIDSIEANCQLILSSPEGEKYVCQPFEKNITILILRRDGIASLESEPYEL